MNQQHVYRFISRADVDDESLTQELLNLGGVLSISRITTLTGQTNFIELTLDHKIDQRQEWSCTLIYPKATQTVPNPWLGSIVVPTPSYVLITFGENYPPQNLSTTISLKIEVPNKNTIKATIFNKGMFVNNLLGF